MADQFSPATEARAIGEKLIKKYHDHLATRRVEFLFVERLDKDGKSQAITKKGKNHLAHAKLVTGLNAYLATAEEDDAKPLFVIVITKHFWDGSTAEFKEALIDHELCHCLYDSETDKYSVEGHDVEEFTAIVKRHGGWKSDLDIFFKAAKQTKLSFGEVVTAPPAPESPDTTPTRPPKVRRIKNKTEAVTALGG